MDEMYLLFKTNGFDQKEIVGASVALSTVKRYLDNDASLLRPTRYGCGWEISKLVYDDSGKACLETIDCYVNKMEGCPFEEIKVGEYYNINYTISETNGSELIRKAKCISSNPSGLIFESKHSKWHVSDKDSSVIVRCRENEDEEDWDRFVTYSNIEQCRRCISTV